MSRFEIFNEFLSTERGIVQLLQRLDTNCIRYDFSDMDAMVRRVELESGISFAPEQRQAIFEASESGVMIITGGPGTGKTTIIKALIRIYESMGCDVALAAPTGRAAKRMSESTSHDAKTIHRLLEVEYRDDDGGGTVFARNERNLLDEDIIIVDEASMIFAACDPTGRKTCADRRLRSASECRRRQCAAGYDRQRRV